LFCVLLPSRSKPRRAAARADDLGPPVVVEVHDRAAVHPEKPLEEDPLGREVRVHVAVVVEVVAG